MLTPFRADKLNVVSETANTLGDKLVPLTQMRDDRLGIALVCSLGASPLAKPDLITGTSEPPVRC